MTRIIEELRKAILDGGILTPGEDGYRESLQRWSATCIQPAVSHSQSILVSLPAHFLFLGHRLTSSSVHRRPTCQRFGGKRRSQVRQVALNTTGGL